jgi:Tfp pilus assembly protein PilE
MGVLMLLIMPVISNYIEKTKKSYYNALEKELSIIAKDYYATNTSELPRGQKNEEGKEIYITKIRLSKLEEKNYITNDVVDQKGNKCEESYVRVENVKGQYKYQTCLICGEYQTKEEYCGVEYMEDNIRPTCEISGEPENWTKENVEITITGTDEGSGIGKFKVEGKQIKPIDNKGKYKATTNKIYEIEVYDKAGNNNTCESEEIKIDKINPYCESIEVENRGVEGERVIKVEGKDELSGINNIKIGTTNYSGGGEKERQ